MISSYGDQSTTEIILHIIIVLHQRCLIALNASRDTLCFIRTVTTSNAHRNGAIKHIFYTNQITEDHQQIVLYSFCRSMRLLFHLAVKILLQIFCKNLGTLTLTYICRLYFPPECQQDRTLLRNQYY